MSPRRVAGASTGVVVGFVAGSLLTLALQGTARLLERTPIPDAGPVTVPEEPATFLAWVPGGMPDGFREAVGQIPRLRRAVVVASDNVWLTRSFTRQGEVVDDPPDGFEIPLEVAAVDPGEYAPFLPPADRGVALALAEGRGVLGESSAKLRGLGDGAVLEFAGRRVEVAAILPDELVGAHELLVSREVGREIGVVRDRYALLQPSDEPTRRELAKRVRSILAPGTPLRVRAPGDTPYFRHGDAVLPPVRIKELFGEFAARQGRPGFLILDPEWVSTHIATERVQILDRVTCNVALIPQIRGAIEELVALGLRDTITGYSGCFAPRHLNRDPTAGISHHAWGIAFDVNVPQNPYGAPPDQDPRMVRVFERWGFVWGGTFVRPDGMHFEYRRAPAGT